MTAPNDQMRDLWTRRAGPGWFAHHDIFARVFEPVSSAIVDAAEPVAGRSVLDVGCGTGGLSRIVADRAGDPVGVDISTTMIDGARQLFPGVRFEVADVQVADLGSFAADGFDRVVSEFGVMFFEDPVAAFENVRSAVTPAATMAFACWRSREENAMFSIGTDLLAARLPDPPPPPMPGQPGPIAFADRDYLATVLADAGWVDTEITAFDVDLRFGADGSDGVEERLAVILSGSTGVTAAEQLPPLLGEDGWNRLLDEVRAEVRTAMVDGVVQFPGRMWMATTHAPT
jgi:SAM-dependent methyltransferase